MPETENNRTTLTVLFADISQSTSFYETLGDQAAQSLVTECLSILSKITASHQGTVIKTIGDEVMCTFPDVSVAFQASKAMHEAFDNMPAVPQPIQSSPNIRIGFHAGPVILKDNDVFGDAVIIAARMVSLAKARQILTTEETVNLLSSEEKASARCIDRTTIKGKGGEHDIYELIWEDENVTVMLQDHISAATTECRLELRFGNICVEVDSKRPTVTLGRHLNNDLCVDGIHASRMHARIEHRRGKFVLIDQSTNGTYVRPNEQDGVSIHRDEITLRGSGIIGLGQELGPDHPQAIHFKYIS